MGDNGGLIYKAIPAIMAEIDAIGKNRKNEQQGYKFRGIDDVYNEAHPLFVKHRVFTVPRVLEKQYDTVVTAKGTNLFYSRLTIQYLFCAEDGSSVEAIVIGEGMDSGDKASNKAMAVAHKYAIIQILAIPTEEPKDPENDSHETVARKLPVEMVDPPKEEHSEARKQLLDRLATLGPFLTEDEKNTMRNDVKLLDTAALANYVQGWEARLHTKGAL